MEDQRVGRKKVKAQKGEGQKRSRSGKNLGSKKVKVKKGQGQKRSRSVKGQVGGQGHFPAECGSYYSHLYALKHTPVSYTHLRAHETPEHLVCRLLLEK